MAGETAANDNFIVHSFGIQIDGVLLEQLKSVSGIGMQQDVITSQHVTDKGIPYTRKQPGAKTTSSITLTRGMDKSKALTDWIKETYDNGDLSKARKGVTIEMKDNKGATVRRITLVNAWVSAWQSGDLIAGQSNAVDETVTIECEDLKVEHS
ncbi:phage tail protein [Streptomyces sp. H27-D2]|uniref:phage tail protein n=1 Tax=Streptomyces sp. H27-D2 TaxID=3046304 RepID=UPI002DB7AD34|nr:phage tail protein [Streptomyces sp. H27-D2]MEC4017971.1 phage tail protein [Streptomyces sp. H27-D2]